MSFILLSSFIILCVSSGFCLEPIPANKGLIPTPDNYYMSSERRYGMLTDGQLVEVLFVDPGDLERPFSARLSMKYNITRTDNPTDRMSLVVVNSIDPESYLEINKDQISYMNGDAWKCNLPEDKLIYNYSDVSSLCDYIKSRAKMYPVNQRIEFQYNPETGIVRSNMNGINHIVVDTDEADEMIDKYFKPSIHNIGDEYIKGQMNITYKNLKGMVRTLYLTNERLYHFYELYNSNNELIMRGYARYYITRSSDDRFTYVKIDSASSKYSMFEFPKGGNEEILTAAGCTSVEKGKNYTVEELAGPCAQVKTLVLGQDGFKYNTMFGSLDSAAKVDIFEGLDVFQANGVIIKGTSGSDTAGVQALVNEIKSFDFNFEMNETDAGVSVIPFFLLVVMAIVMM